MRVAFFFFYVCFVSFFFICLFVGDFFPLIFAFLVYVGDR